MTNAVTQLVVHRHEPMRHELRTTSLPPLGASEILVKVEFFGLSANNVTYAALGKQLPYYDFFPVDEQWSALPVWGIASVLASHADVVPVNSRLFGYFPAASQAVLKVSEVTPTGLKVARPNMPLEMAAYNQYAIAGKDPLYLADREEWMAVLRPLFLTGLLLADYLKVRNRHGAQTIAISSAASKTSYGLALALKQQGERGVLGLGSQHSLASARALDVYDRVLSYDEVASLDPSESIVYVDVSGSQPVRSALARRLGPALRGVVSVGLTHWREGAYGDSGSSEGPPPETFFAPGWMAERSRQEGRAFGMSIGQGWGAQIAAAQKKLAVERRDGADAALSSFAALVEGQVDPERIWVRSL